MNETEHIKELEAENQKLKQLVNDLESTSKMLVHRDIDLRNAYEELKVLDTEKSEFVAIAAHQLRTPLTSIRWAHKLLLSGELEELSPALRDVVQRSHISVEHMYTLVEDLLQVDSLEYGNVEFIPKHGSIEKLLESILDELSAKAEESKVTVERCYATDKRPVFFDPDKMRNVLGNLIDNAIKYTPAGGTVTLRTVYEEGKLKVFVSDTGIGVPPDERLSMFKKFSRLSNAKKVDAGGSGLGLYICKKIIEKHHGTIWYEENVPQGSTFVVTLPH